MIQRLIVFFLLAFFPALSMATHVAVLETVVSNKELMTLSERQYLTNILREQAVKKLSADQKYVVMTSENISMMLPPGKALEDCEGSCMVETGRNIAADYVAQARIGQFGTTLTINVELYETASSKLVDSFNGRGEGVESLEKVIIEKASGLFQNILEPRNDSGAIPPKEEPAEVAGAAQVVEPVWQLDSAQTDSSTYSMELPAATDMKENADVVGHVEWEIESAAPVAEKDKSLQEYSKKRIWGGALVGVTYNDFYDSKLGLANLKSTDEYTLRVQGDNDLVGNYWGVGVNAAIGGLFLFNDYLALRGDVAFAYRQGSGKSDVTIKLFWADESKQQERSDMEIEYSVKQKNIDIPLAFRFMVPGWMYAELGPMMSFNISSETKSEISGGQMYGSYQSVQETYNDFDTFEFAAIAGIGTMRYIGKSILDLNLRLVLGLTRLTEASDAPKTWQWQFNIAYWFI